MNRRQSAGMTFTTTPTSSSVSGEYRTMGEPVDETTLVNRALLPRVGLGVDVLTPRQEERDGQHQDDTGVGSELEQGL